MELFQGEEPAHDFLSLRAGGGSSPFQHRLQSAQQGYGLGPHSLVKPAEPVKQSSSHGGDGAVSAAADLGEQVLPGGVGTFSIRQVPDARPREEAGMGRDASVAAVHQGSRMEIAHEARSGAMVRSAPPSTMWQDSGIDKRSRAARSSGSSADQEPSSPRSKHSATEQRRRTKINDRLDILRELLPNCDQKRDKASFLLEVHITSCELAQQSAGYSCKFSPHAIFCLQVIEYIRLLQEKCQKYESAIPEKDPTDSKSMAWDKVYCRSRWRNTQNISQGQGGGLSAATEDMNNEQHCSPKGITVAPTSLFTTQSVKETSTTASSSQNIIENNMPNNQLSWLSMSTMNQNSNASNSKLSKQETQSLRNDTQSLSSAYSQGLLHKLKEALQKSGVDPSQANISVEINMDKRARANAHIHDNSKANEGKEPMHITKRLRCD
ncbi:transcription factor BIM2 isoform X2 [Brachypodium distachyon]|uniref:transcription factor BIM2 isoform X2 n=1 Tax=Brachypodium distachyon TaxID=15368 RepID=UPI00071C5915|nr:transcription factor BIM2 isoform X2 [Brachypodium distachyon]|eukprot:XP_010236004.2 transcription factor BIM2 isoform X2 [Brachypodium distachyon]